MKKILLLICLLVFSGRLMAQKEVIDSLKHLLSNAKTNSAKIEIIAKLVKEYPEYNADSAIYYANRFYLAGKRSNNRNLKNIALSGLAFSYYVKGNFPVALDNAFHVLRMIENSKDTAFIANTYNMIGNIYKGQQNYPRALYYYRQCKQEAILGRDTTDLTFSYFNMAIVYDLTHVPDSAIIYAKKALAFSPKIENGLQTDVVLAILGDAYAQRGENKTAYSYLRQAYAQNQKKNSYKRNSSIVCVKLSQYFKGIGKRDSAIYYAFKALGYARAVRFKNYEYISTELLSSLYENGHHIDSAYKYLKLSTATNDSLYSAQSIGESEVLTIHEDSRLKEIEQAKATYRNGIKTTLLISGLVIFLVVAGLLWRNNRQKQKANHLLNQQKEEIVTQRDNLGQALEILKKTQTQLIQSEKMASLGELTAGIAHEIQNPLNFVNNFSEVNVELIDEMQQEIDKGDYQEAKAIAGDIKENQIKINQHGKRADFIVKGMLQHSRTSTGEKQLTDINTLADEFFKLSYHGLRAKDKSFDADIVTHFYEALPKINVVQQDIGRVLLNLFNNAFYAVNQKAKTAAPGYKPEVSVSTAKEEDNIVIKVKDNGNGIPEVIRDKIMQPFFTTKPTGEGTGLGLSLSYDIVVKGHGGSLRLKSDEAEGSEFIVHLPIS